MIHEFELRARFVICMSWADARTPRSVSRLSSVSGLLARTIAVPR